MTYRDMAVEVCKIAGKELVDRAEELIPNTTGVKDIDIWIRIPTLTNCLPEIQVNTNVYLTHAACKKITQLVFNEDDDDAS